MGVMHAAKNKVSVIRQWLSIPWVQWSIAVVFFFLLSWLYMGTAINNCSTSSTALGSDSTGGFGWVQWAGGNGLTWDHTNKSNYPYGETLGKPQFITSTLFIGVFKVFASLTTPICGLNLMLLLGYMSTGLLMFGFVRWLIKRFDIALFAGYAAAYVPFHQLKAESHINYVYGSMFIAIIWAYVWLMQRPSYKRSAVFGGVCSLGFYFDGYFILISSLVIAGLCVTTLIFDGLRILRNRHNASASIRLFLKRLKYVTAGLVVLAVLLVPILVVYKTSGHQITQSLAMVRSDIKTETIAYGARPIEFIAPSSDSALLPQKIPFLAVKPHGSNASESTLYIGWTIIILALVALAYLIIGKRGQDKLRGMTYSELVLALVCVFVMCFAFSLPALVTIFGHVFKTPTFVLVKLTANWRALSRIFLAMDPAIVMLASLGLYKLTKSRSAIIKIAVVAVCGLLLFCEFLPAHLHPTQDIYKDAPPVYKMLQKDPSVKLIAEYPITSFLYTPEIFTYQMMDNKTLVNANDGDISVGPVDGSIAGLNDPQTLGVLKSLKVDMVLTHGMRADNSGLTTYYKLKPVINADGTYNAVTSIYSYRIDGSVAVHDSFLVVKKGYESLSVDDSQVSHRFVTSQAVMQVLHTPAIAGSKSYEAAFDISSACPATKAAVNISQSGRNLWTGPVGSTPMPVRLNVSSQDFQISTAYCSIDLTNLSAEAITP